MSDPEREIRPIDASRRDSGATPEPDRWGVKRAENLIQSLSGVLSARVVVSPIGEVTEVHVLTTSGTAPKQVVRNVESALLAHLGLKVDHRKISVAQTAEVKPIEALEQEAVRSESLRRDVVYRSLDAQVAGPHRVKLVITLTANGDEVQGEASCADTPKARFQAVARAVVAALDHVLPQGTLELEGLRRVEAFDHAFAFAGVQVLEGRKALLLAGTALIEEDAEQAAALAVLDATNRWFESRR